MSRSWETNEFGSFSCWGSGPYMLTALGIPDAERAASGWIPMRSYADRWILRVDGQHAQQIPARQREDARLQCVEHHQQKVRLPDLVDLFVSEVVDACIPESSGDHGARGRRDSVRREDLVVRR